MPRFSSVYRMLSPRANVARRNFLRALPDGSAAVKHLKKALALDPTLSDARLERHRELVLNLTQPELVRRPGGQSFPESRIKFSRSFMAAPTVPPARPGPMARPSHGARLAPATAPMAPSASWAR